jgi:hypothetical protein
MDKIGEFINWTKNNGWKISLKEDKKEKLPHNITQRYCIPVEYKEFLSIIEECINADEDTWFLCANDYLRDDGDSFRYNEFETISLEAAEEDKELLNEIKTYWDNHLPIILGVKGDYEYYAINVENKKIVYGCRPEFEESKTVANNFEEFLGKIINKEIKL